MYVKYVIYVDLLILSQYTLFFVEEPQIPKNVQKVDTLLDTNQGPSLTPSYTTSHLWGTLEPPMAQSLLMPARSVMTRQKSARG